MFETAPQTNFCGAPL